MLALRDTFPLPHPFCSGQQGEGRDSGLGAPHLRQMFLICSPSTHPLSSGAEAGRLSGVPHAGCACLLSPAPGSSFPLCAVGVGCMESGCGGRAALLYDWRCDRFSSMKSLRPRPLSPHAGLALGQRKASCLPSLLPLSLGPRRPAASCWERQGSAGSGCRCWVEPALKAALSWLFHAHISCPATRTIRGAPFLHGLGMGEAAHSLHGWDMWETPPLAGRCPPAGSPD